MFTDAYDVKIFKNESTILETFKEFKANVVFGAEFFCNPNRKQCQESYPLIINGKKLFKMYRVSHFHF